MISEDVRDNALGSLGAPLATRLNGPPNPNTMAFNKPSPQKGADLPALITQLLSVLTENLKETITPKLSGIESSTSDLIFQIEICNAVFLFILPRLEMPFCCTFKCSHVVLLPEIHQQCPQQDEAGHDRLRLVNVFQLYFLSLPQQAASDSLLPI